MMIHAPLSPRCVSLVQTPKALVQRAIFHQVGASHDRLPQDAKRQRTPRICMATLRRRIRCDLKVPPRIPLTYAPHSDPLQHGR